MTDDKHIRMKCLELAVHSMTGTYPLFAMEVHKIANKFIEYVDTGEWIQEVIPEAETELTDNSEER